MIATPTNGRGPRERRELEAVFWLTLPGCLVPRRWFLPEVSFVWDPELPIVSRGVVGPVSPSLPPHALRFRQTPPDSVQLKLTSVCSALPRYLARLRLSWRFREEGEDLAFVRQNYLGHLDWVEGGQRDRRQRWQADRRSPARGGDRAGGSPESARLREPPLAALSNGNLAALRHRPSVGPDAARAGPAVRLRCGAQL
ncbi:hypothetical protein LEMLEM_LOCUS11955 [Lemmus lemmus]